MTEALCLTDTEARTCSSPAVVGAPLGVADRGGESGEETVDTGVGAGAGAGTETGVIGRVHGGSGSEGSDR
jgi:hypothetical protein